jgi:predicted esterase
MKETLLKVEKTARIYSLGELNDNTTELVLVCHGYAMLASYFLKKFEPIVNMNRIIVAPEGLSKFYWNGMGGKVRASWMTAEDRENEIEDYINYIEKVVFSFLSQTNNPIKITVIGFSQGATAATRWITNSKINVDRLILWAGGFPKDCTKKYLKKYSNKAIEIVIGNDDEYINQETIIKERNFLNENNIKHTLTKYNGTHKIEIKTLSRLF